MKKIVLILSGGLDSTVLLYHALHNGWSPFCLGFDYGQRHRRELDFARVHTDLLTIPFKVISLENLGDVLAGSSQTDHAVPVPHGHYADESMKATVVPNRNMIMLSIAMAKAISWRAYTVAYGAHAGDHAIYPDCRPEFVKAMGEAGRVCNYNPVVIYTPFLTMTKANIVEYGYKLQVPFKLTYSCYEGMESHCGLCGTCMERQEAFKLAGVIDPTDYEGGN